MPDLNYVSTDPSVPPGAATPLIETIKAGNRPGYNFGQYDTPTGPAGTGYLEFGRGIPGSLPWRVDQDGTMTGRNSVTILNVRNFGAVGNAIADDTAAFNAAILAATGSSNPATTTRYPIAAVYIPPGTYKITSDLIIRSVAGFRLTGAGTDITRIMPSGTGFTQAVIFIDGSADGVFEGFTIQGNTTEGAGASPVPDGIRLDWTAAAARSTTRNLFRDLSIIATNAVKYMNLEGNGTRQLDGTTFINTLMSGNQVPGSWLNTGDSQIGYSFGNGIYANNYDHRGIGVDAAGFYRGYKVSASSMAILGAQPTNNFYDFDIAAAGAGCSFKNIQSQSCNQFLTTPNAFSPVPVSFEDILVNSFYFNSSNILASVIGGMYRFVNFNATNLVNVGGSSYVLGTFNLSGAAAQRPLTVKFENLVMGGARTACILPSGNPADITVINYKNYTVTTGNFTALTAGDLNSVYTGGKWIPLDQVPSAAVLTPAFANGTAAQLSDTTRDYMVYFQIGTAGTAFAIAIGPTNVPANTIVTGAAATGGELYSFRLPAGWYVKWSAVTATLASQAAIGC